MTQPVRGRRALRVTAAIAAVVIGVVLVGATMALGACDAFGGRCPSEPGLHGDVYGTIAVGLALVLIVPLLLALPGRRGVLLSVVVGLPVVAAGTYLLGQTTLS